MKRKNNLEVSSGFFRDEYTEFEIHQMERDNRIRKAFEPLAVDMLDYFKENNAKLYKKLLRILTQEEAVAVIRDALMYSTSCLFESLGFNLLRSQADYCSFFYLHLNDYIRDYAYGLLSRHPTIRKEFQIIPSTSHIEYIFQANGYYGFVFQKVRKAKACSPYNRVCNLGRQEDGRNVSNL